MSENRLISIINETPGWQRLWKQISADGRRRVLRIANGDTFLLGTILEDVLDEEKGR